MNLIQRVYAVATNLDLNNEAAQATTLSGLVSKVVEWLGIIAGALAFIYLIYSGILYITANGNAEQSKKAQTGLINAIIGLIVLALAYTIFKVITGQFNLSVSS